MDSFAVGRSYFSVMARTKDFDESELLTRAMDLFWTRGYNSTSMEDLVNGLGISRSSLYDTYTDKHTLFIKTLENYRQIGQAKIQEIINSTGTVKEKIRKLIELGTNDLSGNKKRTGCLMVNAEVEVAPYDKEVSNMVCRNDQQMEEIFYQLIQKGKKTGEIKNKQDARALARFISNAKKGMHVTAKTTSDKSVFNDIIMLTLSALD
jgi:TetR/AcrR family transcriptional regulator, transcriptional repressor for nem operon